MADPSIFLLQQFRLEIDDGASVDEAYDFVSQNFPDLCAAVRARAMRVGHVPHVQPGQLFLHQYELMLVGLHTHHIRGICTGLYEDGTEVVTCVVAKYPRHNFNLGNDFYVIGGQGGNIDGAHRRGVGIMFDQEFDEENWALGNCIDIGAAVRLVIGGINGEPYVYEGLFTVIDLQDDVTSEQNFTVYKYLLQRRVE